MLRLASLIAALLIGLTPSVVGAQRQSVMEIDERPGYEASADEENLPPALQRQMVYFRSNEQPGTIVVHTSERFLYVLRGGGRRRCRSGSRGRDGFTWQGLHKITRKQEWPDWTPPPEMIERQPYLPRFMAGGPGNPMGARALYIGSTVYRIHGTNMPQTIGKAVSSGCFRLANGEIIDLYERIPVGTKVVVRHAPEL
jgi:lipoprotein-anchoring transpeptidase ErfK/SrfK